jgi:hypothetical protein
MKKAAESTNMLTPFQRFQSLIRGLAAVPKKEVEAEEARWRANRPKKKKRVGDS